MSITFDNSKAVNMFPSEVVFDDTTVKIINVIGWQEVENIHYFTRLVNNSYFQEFSKASILGPAKDWFEDVIQGVGRENFVTCLCHKTLI